MLALGAAVGAGRASSPRDPGFPTMPGAARYSSRLAILFFALAIRPLGVIVTAFASFMIAALGTHVDEVDRGGDRRRVPHGGLRDPFPYILGLPMPMIPRFLIQ